jgi:hypothetical protein
VSATALTREIADAGVGVGRLLRYDPRWPYGFDPTVRGFLRSFLGPLLALPFALVVARIITANQGEANLDLWAAAVSHVVSALAYPVLIALIARPLGLGQGYAGFIVVVNWSSLYLNAAAAAAGALTLFGANGYTLFTLTWFLIFCASLFVIWRAAREILSDDIGPAVLMVVLSVAVTFGVDQLADWLSRLGA